MKVTNWDKWQSFRKDRGTPPWIKLYRSLLSNEQWVILSDEEKGQLVSIWMLAADKGGVIPDCAKMIQRMAMLDKEPNLSKFIELGFLSTTCQPHDNQVVTIPPQLDAPEERRGETEESRDRVETEQSKDTLPSSVEEDSPIKKAAIPYQKILDLYHSILPNEARVKVFSQDRKAAIKARWNTDQNFQSIDFWERLFNYILTSDFLTGKIPPKQGYKQFELSLDFIIAPKSFIKIIEGKYDN